MMLLKELSMNLYKKAFLIQEWYKKYKIKKKKPILFINDLSENKIVKWYLIRIYMKFYPKEDLYDVPYYIIKKQIENESDEKKKENLKKDLFRWSIKTGTNTKRRGYEVYKFLITPKNLRKKMNKFFKDNSSVMPSKSISIGKTSFILFFLILTYSSNK